MGMHEVRLRGCQPVPLASYLKGLAVLRIVVEQADPDARGRFTGEIFALHSSLDRDALLRFLLEEYDPSPVLSPWNGGSGFFPKDNSEAMEVIEAGRHERFSAYRRAVLAGHRILDRAGITEKPDKAEKELLLVRCRNELPDDALPWLDAALTLTNDGAKFPPLLGTGGNDGRLDFSNNFMQRLLDVIDPDTGDPAPGSEARLRSALLEEPYPGGVGVAIGQFLPGDAGGANASTGFSDASNVNPWDFVLMIEGALVFATAAVRRLEVERRDTLAFPFTVHPASVGYGNAAEAEADDSRGEIWLPVWDRPAGATEVRALFAEGRARVGRRPVRDGIDFARAVATLGVDRGVTSFHRYGVHRRMGRNYFATPLARLDVRRSKGAALVDEIDPWLESFRHRRDLPGSVASAMRAVERSILDVCRFDDTIRVQALLVALGRLNGALARSLEFSLERRIRPVPLLSPRWLAESADGSPEFRLAAALATSGGVYGGEYLPLRRQVEPVKGVWRSGRRTTAWIEGPDRDVVPDTGDPVRWLNAILGRRIVLAVQRGTRGQSGPSGGEAMSGNTGTSDDVGRPTRAGTTWPDRSRVSADLTDVAAFVERRTDDRRLVDLLRGLLLVDAAKLDAEHLPDPVPCRSPWPDALYALLKLCLAGRPVRDVQVPLIPLIHTRAAAGDGQGAAVAAVRRLRGSGLAPRIQAPRREGAGVRRAAAALLFPLGWSQIADLAKLVLHEQDNTEDSQVTADQGGQGGK